MQHPIPLTRPAAKDIPRRAFLTALALGVGAVGLAGCTVVSGEVGSAVESGMKLSKEPAPGRERTIEMYNIWGGLAGNAWCALAELYEKSQSHTGVRVTYAPQSGNTQVRLLTSIAAGTPPDIAFTTPDQYPQLVGLDVITNLDDYLKRAGLGKDDYIPAIWKQMSVTGSVYTLPGMVDPNFPMFWNKKLFAEVGLDPEQGPVTMDDVDSISDKLLQHEGRRITRIGTIPWDYYGYSNAMYLLGYAFGGKFVSDDNEAATADHENNVTALTWLCDFAKRMGGASNISVKSPSDALPLMASNKVGMAPMTTLDSTNVFTNAKDVEMGSALFPYAEGLGTPGSAAFLGGWDIFIPKGCAYPDSAWDFAHFATATAKGTNENFAKQGAVPGVMDAPALEKLHADPQMAIFRDVLLNCKNMAPTIPVANVYSDQLSINVGKAVFGMMTPQHALEKVNSVVNSEWDNFRRDHP